MRSDLMTEEYLTFKESNCTNCYKCIRHCPVKSIQFSSHQAHILSDECILCGNCVNICPQEAKQIRSDIDYVKDAIFREKKVIASLAPSFVANYKGKSFSSIKNALLRLGFAEVEETAIGASIVKDGYDLFLKDKTEGVFLTSCCPTVNLLIMKYYPSLINNLIPVLSPMEAHSQEIKKKDPEAIVVFIGPCISKKKEADDSLGLTSFALTFKELTTWMNQEKVELLELDDDSMTMRKSRIFPTSGGIIESMSCDNPNFDYYHVDGIQQIINVLQEIESNQLHHCVIEMSACISGCVGGPGMDDKEMTPISSMKQIKKYQGKSQAYLDEMDNTLDISKIEKKFYSQEIKKSIPSETIIQSILQKMGKASKKDELNCGSCGYDTCRDKAIALYQGKAEISMCLPYLKEKAESFTEGIITNTPNGIIVLNNQFSVQLINQSACKLLRVNKPSDVMNQNILKILDFSPYLDIIETKQNHPTTRRYLAEYDSYVDETVIYDHKFQIIMIILRDATIEEKAKIHKEKMSKNTIEVADKIIEKQMKAVQEIVSLLGESSAEVKVAISKLKDTMNHE